MVINVVASEQTVYGDSAAPGYLEGYGVIDAEQVRALAAAASILIADPLTSPVRGAALPALGGAGARGALPGSHLPLPRV